MTTPEIGEKKSDESVTLWHCSNCPYGPCMISIDGECFFTPEIIDSDQCLVNPKTQDANWIRVD